MWILNFFSWQRQGEKRMEEWESFQQGDRILREDYQEATELSLPHYRKKNLY